MTNKTGLGVYTLAGLVMANMIGAGVFTTSGFAMGDLGSPVYVLAAWLVGGIIAVCGAISYGSLSRLMPISGGEYLFLSRSIHPLAGFIAGWISLLAGFTGAIAYAAITFEAYLLPEELRNLMPGNVVATLAIIFAATIHGIRVKHGALIQNVTVTLKLILILVLVSIAALGLPFESWEGVRSYSESASPGFSISAFAVTLMWISFSYSGFNAAIYIASEAEDARRNVPRAMLYATLITTLIYLLLNTIFVLAPSMEAVAYREDVAAVAANALGGDALAIIVRIIITIALFTSISAMIMVGPRVYAQMAEDGLMPRSLKISRDTPDISIAMQALLAIIVVWMTGLQKLLNYLGFTLGLSAVATIASLFVIVKRDNGLRKLLWGYPWAPLIFIGFTLLFAGIAATRNPWEMLAAIITIISGVFTYYIFRIVKG